MNKDICKEIINGIIAGHSLPIKIFEEIDFHCHLIKCYHTYKQRGGNICGFFALFNITNFINWKKTENDNHFKRMNNSFEFWDFYYNTLKFLLNNLFIEKSGIESLTKNGILERYQFDFLIKKSGILNDHNYSVDYIRLFFGFGRINGMSFNDIKSYQRIIETFSNLCVVLLGITNHWSVMIVEKKNDKNVYHYLDSRNNFEIFNEPLRKEDIVQKLTEESREYSNGKSPSEWWVQCTSSWVDDIRKAVEILIDVFEGKENLCNLVVSQYMNEVIQDFEEHTKIDLMQLEKDFDSNKIENWIFNNYHPTTFYNDIIDPLLSFSFTNNKIKSLKNYKKFFNLISFIEDYIRKYEESKNENEIISRYKEEVNKIKGLVY